MNLSKDLKEVFLWKLSKFPNPACPAKSLTKTLPTPLSFHFLQNCKAGPKNGVKYYRLCIHLQWDWKNPLAIISMAFLHVGMKFYRFRVHFQWDPENPLAITSEKLL